MRPTVLILCLLAGVSPTWGSDPLREWRFETADSPTESCELRGPWDLVNGVVGKALRFDGYRTELVCRDAGPNGAFTLSAWVAPQEYSWNVSAIVDQQQDFKRGHLLGIDHLGRLVGGVATATGWNPCLSNTSLPLLEWTHVAMSYDPADGIRLYLNGKPAGETRVVGDPVFAHDLPIVLGKTQTKMTPANTERATSKAVLSWMRFDGLLDEVRIHAGALDPESIARMHASTPVAEPKPLKFRKLPSGTDEPRPFGAYMTRLSFSPGWDAQWKGSDCPDIVVRFDDSPVKLVFWRGTGYIPALVTENGIWMSDQSGENFGTGECYEAMGDKQCRYSHVRILENTAARVVIHWRYALASIRHKIMNESDDDSGDWMDEYWTAWPDGVVTRKQVLWSEFRNPRHYQFQETIFFNQPGTKPQDNVDDDAITFMDMDGSTATYSWRERAPKRFDHGPEHMAVEMVNTKSHYRPFSIHHPLRVTQPFTFGWMQGYSTFPCWNHWPVSQIASDGRKAQAPDKASHSSLTAINGNLQKFERFPDGSVRVRSLMGMTTGAIDSLLPLARSWNQAPEVVSSSNGLIARGYDSYQRAYLFERSGKTTGALEFTVAASESSPLVNLPLVIRNWTQETPTVEVVDSNTPTDGGCRIGRVAALEGDSLVVWIPIRSSKPITVRIR